MEEWPPQKKGSRKSTVRKVGVPLFVGLLLGAALAVGLGISPDRLPSIETNASDIIQSDEETENEQVRGFDRIAVERHFIEEYNTDRTENGWLNVTRSQTLREMGEKHSQHMLENDYFAHEEPDGTTIRDRFAARGLIPECNYDIQRTDRHYEGAENIAGTWVGQRIESSWSNIPTTIETEEELAEHLYTMWLTSSGHRRAMMQPGVRTVGLGIAMNESGYTLASLEMCGSNAVS